jgi:hypothetical protein
VLAQLSAPLRCPVVRGRWSRLACLFACVPLSLPYVAGAASPPLADRVPGDAILYAGWAGADGCPGYDGSHLKAVIGASSIPQLFAEFVPQLVRRVGRLDDHAGAVLDRLVSAGSPAWHHPTAFYFGGVDLTGPKPLPRVAVLCDAGPDAASLSEQLDELIGELPPDADPRPTVRAYGSLVVLSLFPPDQSDGLFAHAPADALGSSGKFTAALGQCRPAGAALVGYADVEAAVSAADGAIRKVGDPGQVDTWSKVRTSLGLDGFRQVALTAGFDGRDWMERTFASTDGRHAGLLSLLDARPLDADLLGIVPRSADRVAAGRFDFAAAFDALHDAAVTFSPENAGHVDDAVNQVNGQAGINVRRDLLGAIGDQWVTYSDRSIGGSGILGSVLVNRLRDPARADAAMTQLSRRLNFIITRQLQNPNVEIQFRDTTANGTTLHYLAVPLVTPTWAVKHGTLFVGLYPQVVAAAVDAADHPVPSILQRPAFTALMHRLGDHPAASETFIDLPSIAPDGYTDLLGTSRLFLGLGDVFGAHPPALVVPPLRAVLAELSPSGAVTWADAAGWHSAAVSPFPGAEVLSGGNSGGGGLAQLPVLFGVLSQAMSDHLNWSR